jgi:nanoRNase/pAp phosphatase (c-di-AMP/oligoRNAs hydrolase)
MDVAAKQQVVERIKQAQNVLVTVSTDPSVDQLAACIGLTLLLNKLGKHATAVFSGKIPSTLEFLQPSKTIERNTDSLRDFIISLDKEKADKLRYKVEDQVVKIFITPYHTSLSENDLVFSQGDYNIEVVMALGVKERTQLDAALTAHGRILHDATVISVNTGNGKVPDLGQINWQEPTSSSLSEMLVSISEAFGPNLIDPQMATAFLTGIVAETQRFSNVKTSPKVMTMSAQLMAAGANQQLIVSKLEAPKPAGPQQPAAAAEKYQGKVEGELSVNHSKGEEQAEQSDTISAEIHIDKEGNILRPNGPAVPAAELSHPAPAEAPAVEAAPLTPPPAAETPATTPEEGPAKEDKPEEPPLPGGHTLLNPQISSPALGTPFTANTQPDWGGGFETNAPDPLTGPDTPPDGFLNHLPAVKPPSEANKGVGPTIIQPPETSQPETPAGPTPPLDEARSAVDSAYAAAPYTPDLAPIQALNAVPLGGELHPPEADPQTAAEQPDAPAPPPLPPPLMPSPGIVIPNQPYTPAGTSNNQKNG